MVPLSEPQSGVGQRIEVEISMVVPVPGRDYVNIKPSLRIADSVRPGETWAGAYQRLRAIVKFLWMKELVAQLSENKALLSDLPAVLEDYFRVHS